MQDATGRILEAIRSNFNAAILSLSIFQRIRRHAACRTCGTIDPRKPFLSFPTHLIDFNACAGLRRVNYLALDGAFFFMRTKKGRTAKTKPRALRNGSTIT